MLPQPPSCALRVAAAVLLFAVSSAAQGQDEGLISPEASARLERLRTLLADADPALGDALAADWIAKAEASASWVELNDIAWSYVDPQAKVTRRNFALARRAVEAANKASGDKEPQALDTLARLHAWEGDLALAADVQRRALALAPTRFLHGSRGELAAAAIEYEERLRASAPRPAAAGPRVPTGCAPAAAAAVDGWCKVVVHKATGMRFRYVAGGEFAMGRGPGDVEDLLTPERKEKHARNLDADLPQRRVRVSPCYIAEQEASVAHWRKFVAATGYRTDAELGGDRVTRTTLVIKDDGRWAMSSIREATWENPLPYFSGRREFALDDRQPVTTVSWNDAVMFCAQFGMRLPTEAEWEHAARGGVAARYWWGDDPAGGMGKENVLDQSGPGYPFTAKSAPVFPFHDGHAMLAPVDAMPPNPFGLRNMLGNVCEWCSDPGDPQYLQGLPSDGVATDPVAQGQPELPYSRTIRGGAWLADPLTTRVSARVVVMQFACSSICGFRPALSLH